MSLEVLDRPVSTGGETARAELPTPESRHGWETFTPWRGLTFLRDLLRNRRGADTLPRFLTYTVTFGCNARCIMCDSWKMPSPNDLTLDELERIFRQLPLMDGVRLTGGEPFVRRDMLQIAELVGGLLKPFVLHVTTNGFLTERVVEFCEQRDRRVPLQLMVSIDGVGEKHNQVRGHSRAWDMVMETIQAVAPLQKRLGLRLMVNQTIVDVEGVAHYRQLREVLRPHGVYNNVVMAYDTSATYNLEKDVNVAPTEAGRFTTFGEFTDADLRTLIAQIEEDLPQLPFWERLAKRYYLKGLAKRLLERRGSPNPSCVALNSHLRIFPNGDVPTCQFNSRVIGNLREQSFADVWKCETAAAQRKWVRACAGCWAECEVLPSALYTGDLLSIQHASRAGRAT